MSGISLRAGERLTWRQRGFVRMVAVGPQGPPGPPGADGAAATDADVAGYLGDPTSQTRVAGDALYASQAQGAAADAAQPAATLDADTAANVADPATQTGQALSAAVGPVVRGDAGRTYGVILGALRNPGTGWEAIDDTGHQPSFIDSVAADADAIRVSHAAMGVSRVGSIIAVCDESLTAAGFSCGSSVGIDLTSVLLYRDYQAVSDYVYFDGTSWVSYYGVFSGITFADGALTLNHRNIEFNDAAFSASAMVRDGAYLCNVTGSASVGRVIIQFRDYTGALVTTPDTGMKIFVSHGHGGQRALVDPTTIDTGAYPNSNIWLLGVMNT